MANATGLGPLLFLAGIIIFLVSPQKRKTLGRMLLAFVIAIAVLLVLGPVLRTRDPELIGALTAQIAFGVADAFGLFHVLALRRARQTKSFDSGVK